MDSKDLLASVLVDNAIAASMMPWSCPCDFGPDARYRLLELVGVGRDSLVYKGHDRLLSSEGFSAAVAIKVMHAEAAQREALAARRVVNPYVLRVLDRGIDRESQAAYIVTEYIEGGDLSQKSEPWELDDAVTFMTKVAKGVQAAHAAGIVHCDLKPANIFLTADGEPKVGDFDLSASPLNPSQANRGNVAFMSPEQFAAEENSLSPPSDIYALGGLLYFLTTGQLPNGASHLEVSQRHAGTIKPARGGVRGDLSRIITRAMDPVRDRRHASAAEFVQDLEHWQRHQPLEWTRPSMAKRVTLWGLRRSKRSVALVAALIAVGAAAGLAVYTHVTEIRREKLAQEEVDRTVTGRVDEFSIDARTILKSIDSRLMANVHTDRMDLLLPALVWLQWLEGTAVIDQAGKVESARNRVTMLQRALAEMEAEGFENSLNADLTRYCLIYFKLGNKDYEGIAKLVDQTERSLLPRLASADPMRQELAAMRQCADATKLVGEAIEPAAQALTRTAVELQGRGGSEPTVRLVMVMVKRLREHQRQAPRMKAP